jgi:inosose dehydratase
VSAAGYSGIDLGPVGYLGDSSSLAGRLEEYELGLAGGYLALTFEDRAVLEEELAGLDMLLDVFDAAGPGRVRAKPTLAAVAMPAARLTLPAERPARTDREWQRFADGVTVALERCRARELEPSFHHHVGSWIETPAEIERLLSLTDISLCLDTGHLAVSGGEPAQAMRDWAERINHVHVKDARLPAIDALVSRGDEVDALWRGEVFRPLGDGDLGCDAFLEALRSSGYAGWIVVEQDIFPPRGGQVLQTRSDQVRSRAFLKRHGF